MRDYYRILGIRPDATQAEIREAWVFSINAFHPDKFAGSSQRKEVVAQRWEFVVKIADAALWLGWLLSGGPEYAGTHESYRSNIVQCAAIAVSQERTRNR